MMKFLSKKTKKEPIIASSQVKKDIQGFIYQNMNNSGLPKMGIVDDNGVRNITIYDLKDTINIINDNPKDFVMDNTFYNNFLKWGKRYKLNISDEFHILRRDDVEPLLIEYVSKLPDTAVDEFLSGIDKSYSSKIDKQFLENFKRINKEKQTQQETQQEKELKKTLKDIEDLIKDLTDADYHIPPSLEHRRNEVLALLTPPPPPSFAAEDPVLLSQIVADDKQKEVELKKQVLENQKEHMAGLTLKTEDVSVLQEDVNLAIKTTKEDTQTSSKPTSPPASVGSGSSIEEVPPAQPAQPAQSYPEQQSVSGESGTWVFESPIPGSVGSVGSVGGGDTGGMGGEGDGGMTEQQQNIDQSQVPATGIAGAAAEPSIITGAKYHRVPITIFFNDADNPMWDNDLTANIKKSKVSSDEALTIINDIIDSEGSQILVSSAKSSGDEQELIEILQLHFSLHRQMSKGSRIPSVGIPLSALLSTMNPVANQPTTDTSTKPIEQSIEPEQPTSVNLSKAWENRLDWSGALRNGPQNHPFMPLVQEATNIKIYNETGPGLEPKRIRGIQLLRVQMENDDC